MMIAALAEAATLFNRADWLALAQNAYQGARDALTDENGNLCHAARAGKQLSVSLSGDYGFMGLAACALYRATSATPYLAHAEADAHKLHALFHDTARGGYFTNPAQEEGILVNNKPVHDNAQPSANAAALGLFAQLATLTGAASWRDKAEQGFADLAGHLATNYPSMTSLFSVRLALDHPLSLIIIGDEDCAARAALTETAIKHPIFDRHIVTMSADAAAGLPASHPAHGKTMIDGHATAYICPDQSCLPPVTAPADLIAALDALILARQTDGEG